MDISPNDIAAVINTHFHFDHCGYNRSFPDATFYVQKSHYEFAKKSNYRIFGYSERDWDDPSINYQLVDGDKEILPGIQVIRTDGHEIGIQSVIVNLKNTGNVLIASDAISDSRMLSDNNNPAQYSMFNRDPENVRKGIIKLKEIIKDKDIKLIIYNHDSEMWPTYKKMPDYYD
jgi:N-acyl homoserine lactone hydrolase